MPGITRYGYRDAQVQIVERSETRELVSETTGERWQEQLGVLDTRIAPGIQTHVDSITFPGAVHFDEKFLRTQVFSYLEEDLPGSALRSPVDSELADDLGFGGGGPARQREVPEPMLLDPHRMFYAPSYDQAVDHIRELYRGDGYLDVKISGGTLTALFYNAAGTVKDSLTVTKTLPTALPSDTSGVTASALETAPGPVDDPANAPEGLRFDKELPPAESLEATADNHPVFR